MQPYDTPIDETDGVQRLPPRFGENTNDAVKRTRVPNIDSDSKMEDEEEILEGVKTSNAAVTAYLEWVFSKKFEAIQSRVERLPGVAPPIRRIDPNSYADTHFVEDIALEDMPHKFAFPTITMYDGTSDPDNHVAQYKQEMLTVAIQKKLREATILP